jgi:hypothetical protein
MERNIRGYKVKMVFIKLFAGALVVTPGSIKQYIQLAGPKMRLQQME